MKPQILYLLIACILMLGGCSRCKTDTPKCSDNDSLNCNAVFYCRISGKTWKLPSPNVRDSTAFVQEANPLMVDYSYKIRIVGNQTGAKFTIGSDPRTYSDSATIVFDQPYKRIPISITAWRSKDRCNVSVYDTIRKVQYIEVDTSNDWRFDGYYRGYDASGEPRIVQIQHFGGVVDAYGCNRRTVFRNFFKDKDSIQLGLECNNTRQRGALVQASKNSLWMQYEYSGASAWMHFRNDSLFAKLYYVEPFTGRVEYLKFKRI